MGLDLAVMGDRGDSLSMKQRSTHSIQCSRLTLVVATVAGLGLALTGCSSTPETSTAQFCKSANAVNKKLNDLPEVTEQNAEAVLSEIASDLQEGQSALPSDAPSQVTSAFSDAIRSLQNPVVATRTELETAWTTITSYVSGVCGASAVASPSGSSTS
jgi:hypothetical protein